MATPFERPFKPVQFPQSAIEAFPLQAMASQLMTEDPFTKHGRNGLTLARNKDLTLVLTVVKEGKVCQEHKAPGLTTLVLLSGHVSLLTNPTGQHMTLDSGTAAALPADIAYVVKAHRDSVFLTVIGGNRAAA